MQWLNRLIGNLLNSCGLDTKDKIGGSVQFFLYDTIKIMVLIGVMVLLISYIQSYFPPERTKKFLGRFHGIGANIVAALLGTVTPFCSCSSIPYENAKEAVQKMGLSVEVKYITDLQKVMEYGVMSMPALVANEKVVSMGKVLKANDVEKLLHKLGF